MSPLDMALFQVGHAVKIRLGGKKVEAFRVCIDIRDIVYFRIVYGGKLDQERVNGISSSDSEYVSAVFHPVDNSTDVLTSFGCGDTFYTQIVQNVQNNATPAAGGPGGFNCRSLYR